MGSVPEKVPGRTVKGILDLSVGESLKVLCSLNHLSGTYESPNIEETFCLLSYGLSVKGFSKGSV